jgi:hypothetical protein
MVQRIRQRMRLRRVLARGRSERRRRQLKGRQRRSAGPSRAQRLLDLEARPHARGDRKGRQVGNGRVSSGRDGQDRDGDAGERGRGKGKVAQPESVPREGAREVRRIQGEEIASAILRAGGRGAISKQETISGQILKG